MIRPHGRCRYCAEPLTDRRSVSTCGAEECRQQYRNDYMPGYRERLRASGRKERRSSRELLEDLAAKHIPPVIYERTCNRCDQPYRGTGRLLCDDCRRHADSHAPIDVGGLPAWMGS